MINTNDTSLIANFIIEGRGSIPPCPDRLSQQCIRSSLDNATIQNKKVNGHCVPSWTMSPFHDLSLAGNTSIKLTPPIKGQAHLPFRKRKHPGEYDHPGCQKTPALANSKTDDSLGIPADRNPMLRALLDKEPVPFQHKRLESPSPIARK